MSKKPMYEIPGTIAYALMQNRAKWCEAKTAPELKKKAIEIINESNLKNEKDREDFISRVNNCTGVSNLMSTLGTYMTGMKC